MSVLLTGGWRPSPGSTVLPPPPSSQKKFHTTYALLNPTNDPSIFLDTATATGQGQKNITPIRFGAASTLRARYRWKQRCRLCLNQQHSPHVSRERPSTRKKLRKKLLVSSWNKAVDKLREKSAAALSEGRLSKGLYFRKNENYPASFLCRLLSTQDVYPPSKTS